MARERSQNEWILEGIKKRGAEPSGERMGDD
jgi:hypothetical protein